VSTIKPSRLGRPPVDRNSRDLYIAKRAQKPHGVVDVNDTSIPQRAFPC
jgi:hypothetical protein